MSGAVRFIKKATLVLALAVVAPCGGANAGILQVLHNFSGGNDGAYPFGGLAADGAGNFYGTTSEGGPNDLGTLFELAPDGTTTVLHQFSGGKDGGDPEASLIADRKGNFYGTTHIGVRVQSGNRVRSDQGWKAEGAL